MRELLRPKQPKGLKCWACVDNDGTRKIFTQEPISVGQEMWWTESSWNNCKRIIPDTVTKAIFPDGIKPGECKPVILPVAVADNTR